MNKYRDYYLKDINTSLVGKNITVSGWVNRSRDHGNLLFIDIKLWTEEELLHLVELVLIDFSNSLSLASKMNIVNNSNNLPNVLKSIIEMAELEQCSIEEAISIVKLDK